MIKVNKENKKKKSGMTITQKRAFAGYFFILPWFLGLVYFFLIPFIQGIVYTFNKISMDGSKVVLTFNGITNYVNAFTDTEFVQKLTNALVSMVPQVLIIVFFSLFVAIILREKFKGRTFARAIFFLPVIISSGVVITILQDNIFGGNASTVVKEASYLFKAPNFNETLSNLGLPAFILDKFEWIVNELFNLTWKSGVQILLLLAAVNNIPKSSYEVADIEGATEWEKFWKITFPMVSPTLLVAVIYTIVDSFTDYGNKVMRMVSDKMMGGFYEYSVTLAYIYFVCVLVIIAIVGYFMSRHTFYMSD